MCDSTFDRTLYPAFQRKNLLNKEQVPSVDRNNRKKTSLPKGWIIEEKGPHDSVKTLLDKIVPED